MYVCVCSFEHRGRLFLSTFLLGSICAEIGGVLLLIIMPSGLKGKTFNGIMNPTIVRNHINDNNESHTWNFPCYTLYRCLLPHRLAINYACSSPSHVSLLLVNSSFHSSSIFVNIETQSFNITSSTFKLHT